MKLFRHSNGTIFAFGFDMITREPNKHRICFSDPKICTWEMTKDNEAGCFHHDNIDLDFEYVEELEDGSVIAHRPGIVVTLRPIGKPLVWSMAIDPFPTIQHAFSQYPEGREP